MDRTVQGRCGPSTALLRGGSLNSVVQHYWGTEVVPRDFDRTTAGPALFTTALLRDPDCIVYGLPTTNISPDVINMIGMTWNFAQKP